MLTGHTELVIQCVLDRLTKMSNFDFNRDYTPVDLVKQNLIDAIKIFVKYEPHKLQKLNDNRERLIFSISLIDNIINILLANNQNKMEIYNYLLTASQAGLSFTDEGIIRFLSTIPDELLLETDVSGWDFTLKPWEFQLDLDRRADLNQGHGTLWYHLLKVQYFCMQRKVMVLSDGTMYAQVLPGIMPSGYNSTTSTNSAIRAGNHYVCAAKLDFKPWCKTMGDDSLERLHARLAQAYKDLGKTIKSTRVVTKVQGFEFCSQMFKDGVAYPVSADKQLFNLLNYTSSSQQEIEMRHMQFKHELRHHPKLNVFLALIVASGWLQQAAACILGGLFIDTKTVSVLTQMPRDCTVSSMNSFATCNYLSISSFECQTMYSPGSHTVSNTMTKTKSQKKKSAKAATKTVTRKMNNMQVSAKPKPKPTPFSDVGHILGSSIGGLFGGSGIGGNIGKFLGSGIGSIFGSGDYSLTGPNTKYNILTNSSQIPKFSTTERTNVICHREYLGDIQGTAAFNNVAYPLNPGISTTFPWLSSIAENFQEYRFHGIIFEFRPLITDFVTSGSPGVIVMGTQYNADAPIYTTKQAMENSEYAVSVKPTLPLIHGIECATPLTTLPQRYVRTGALPSSQDLRFTDYGIFQFATQANPIQNLGELYVSYCVEFFKPELPTDVGGNVTSGHVSRSASTNASPMGATSKFVSGTLLIAVNPTSFSWLASPAQQYLVTLFWSGTSVPCTIPSQTYTGLAQQTLWIGDTSAAAVAGNGATTTTMSFSTIVQCNLLSPGVVTITLGVAGSIPAGTVDVYVTEISNTITT